MPKYPGQIDDSTSLPTAVDNVTPIRGLTFNRLRDAVIAIEAELGVKPSGSYGTVRGRLDAIETTLGGLQIIELDTDLGGTLENPKVIGLQGRPLSSVAPNFGEILTWNGIAWIPAAVSIPSTDGYATISYVNSHLDGYASLTYLASQLAQETLAKVLGRGNTTDGYNIQFKNNSNIQIHTTNTSGFNINWTGGVSGNAHDINITGQNSTGADGNGGGIVLTPGLNNGSGNDGYVVVDGSMYVTGRNIDPSFSDPPGYGGFRTPTNFLFVGRQYAGDDGIPFLTWGQFDVNVVQLGDENGKGVVINGGNSDGATQFWSANTSQLLSIKDSTLSGHIGGTEISCNTESLAFTGSKIFFSIPNPDLGGVLAVGYGGDPETTPAFIWANGFVRIYEQGGTNTSLKLDAATARIGLDGITSGSTKTLFINGQSTTGTSGFDGYAGSLSISAGNSAGGSGTRVGGDVSISAGTGATADGSINLGSVTKLLSTLVWNANSITNTTGNLDINSVGNVLTCTVNNGTFITKTIVDTGNKPKGSWFLIRDLGVTAGPSTNLLYINDPNSNTLIQLHPSDESATVVVWALIVKMGTANTTWTLIASGH